MSVRNVETTRIVGLLPGLDPEARRQLERLLTNALADPGAARVRHERLGLLADLLLTGWGAVPSEEDYDAAVAARPDEGRPPATTLKTYWGLWSSVVKAASSVAWMTSDARIHRDTRHARSKTRRGRRTRGRAPETACTREDAKSALRMARRFIGDLPTTTEYVAFAKLQRDISALHGVQPPILPSLRRIALLFGDFDTAKRGIDESS